MKLVSFFKNLLRYFNFSKKQLPLIALERKHHFSAIVSLYWPRKINIDILCSRKHFLKQYSDLQQDSIPRKTILISGFEKENEIFFVQCVDRIQDKKATVI